MDAPKFCQYAWTIFKVRNMITSEIYRPIQNMYSTEYMPRKYVFRWCKSFRSGRRPHLLDQVSVVSSHLLRKSPWPAVSVHHILYCFYSLGNVWYIKMSDWVSFQINHIARTTVRYTDDTDSSPKLDTFSFFWLYSF